MTKIHTHKCIHKQTALEQSTNEPQWWGAYLYRLVSFCVLFPVSPVTGKCLRRSGHLSPCSFSTLHVYLILPPSTFIHPLHLFCTKNNGFRYCRESMTSHIKHTSEGDPRPMTRGPTLSLYKSNSLECRDPEKGSPKSGCGMITDPEGLGEAGGSEKYTPWFVLCSPSFVAACIIGPI